MFEKEIGYGFLLGGGISGSAYFMHHGLSEETEVEYWIWVESDGNIGVPLTIELNESWWLKAYHRFFLEGRSERKLFVNPNGGTVSDKKQRNEDKNEFKKDCRTILGSRFKDVSGDNFLRARKWCVTYKTLEESDDFKDKEMEEENSNAWKTKYNTLSEDAEIKDILEEIENKKLSTTKNKRKKAVYKWCTMAMDASADYSLKEKVKSNCLKNGR